MPENEQQPSEAPSSQPKPTKAPSPYESLEIAAGAAIINIARVCHEANRAYCLGLGDRSQKPWSEAPEWQKESAIRGVMATIETNNHNPAVSHENWLKQKQKEGWKFGPKKDPEKKEHPCMVPFDQLPREQRMKDHLFLSIVRTLIVNL